MILTEIIISMKYQKNLYDLKMMSGPVYTTEHQHHFTKIDTIMNDLKTLAGPVYQIESAHKFQEIEQIVADLKTLQGPVYSIERAHNFAEVEKRIAEVWKGLAATDVGLAEVKAQADAIAKVTDALWSEGVLMRRIWHIH